MSLITALSGMRIDDFERQSSAVEWSMSVLDTSSRLLLDFYEHAPCGFHSLDPNGIFLYINNTELDWLGYCREEVVGRMNLCDVLTPEGRRVFERSFPRLKQEGKLRDVEFEFVRKNGSHLPVFISATAVLDANGKFAMCHSIVCDMSHRKAADVRFRCILEAASDAVLICNSSGIITLANGGVEKVFGYSKEELQGQPVENLIGEESRASHRELRSHFFLHPNSRPMGAVRSLTGLRKDGTRVPIEINLSPIDTEEELSALAVIRDVTDRRAAELELRRSEELYRSVVSAMAEGVVVQERDGHISACNESAQRILGMTEDQILGRTSVDPRWKAIHEDGSPFPGDTHPSMLALQTGQRQSGVCMGLQKSKEELTWLLINAEPIFSPGMQQPRAVVTTFTDITLRKKLEEQVSRGQRLEAVGRLAGGVAHDFNNVLGIILGHCDLMAERLPSSDARSSVHLKAIRKSAEHAAALTRQLLAFSRKQVMQMRRLDLNEVVHSLMEMLKRLIGENIELVLQLDPELGRVSADPVQIEQVVMNLVVNARDAMSNGGTLKISTANVEVNSTLTANSRPLAAGSYVMLTVSDNGHGMDEQTLSRLFEPFYTTKEMGRGTGLGLSIIYGIVRQSSGHILVESEPNAGSTFKVYLPRVEGSEAEIPVSIPARSQPTKGATILLVDDDPDVREMMVAMLGHSGYTILSAASARDALAVSDSHPEPIALMVTDMMLAGGIDGQELSNQILARRPDIRILMVSGYSESMINRSTVSRNRVDFMEKPFSSEQLRQRVLDILTRPDGSPPSGVDRH